MSQETPPAPTRADRAGEEDIPGARMAALTAYLELHGGAYTEPALRRAALEAGYTSGEIDTALQRLAVADPATDPGRPPVSGATAGLTFIGFIIAVWLGLSAIDSLGRVVAPDLPLAVVGWLAVGLIGTAVWWWSRDAHPSLARGVAAGVIVIIVLPAVLILVVFGICVVAGGTTVSL